MMSTCYRKAKCLFLASLFILSSCLISCKKTVPAYDKSKGAIEAEDCLIQSGKKKDDPRCSGKEYVTELDGEKGAVLFTYEAEESGYYDLSVDYLIDSEPGTLSLLVNGHFFAKMEFAEGSGTVMETVFLDKGKGEIRFTHLPGDGNIGLDRFTVVKSGKKVSLIVAPHQDDEILAFAGTIRQTVANGDIVKVVFLTNGDYFGKELIPVRMQESIRALEHVGVKKSDILFLGYGDLTLISMCLGENKDGIYDDFAGLYQTSGDESAGIYDYHFLEQGKPADFTYNNFFGDLKQVIETFRPERIYTTSEFEWHPDHQYAFLSVKAAISAISEKKEYHPVLCESVIHGEEGITWPELLSYGEDGSMLITEFTDPFPTMKTSLDWEKVTRITLSDEDVLCKKEAIDEFDSQNNGGTNYPGNSDLNYAFCKRDEFYWEFVF